MTGKKMMRKGCIMYGAKKFLFSIVGTLVLGFMVFATVSCMKKKQDEELSLFIEKFRQEYKRPGAGQILGCHEAET